MARGQGPSLRKVTFFGFLYSCVRDHTKLTLSGKWRKIHYGGFQVIIIIPNRGVIIPKFKVYSLNWEILRYPIVFMTLAIFFGHFSRGLSTSREIIFGVNIIIVRHLMTLGNRRNLVFYCISFFFCHFTDVELGKYYSTIVYLCSIVKIAIYLNTSCKYTICILYIHIRRYIHNRSTPPRRWNINLRKTSFHTLRSL